MLRRLPAALAACGVAACAFASAGCGGTGLLTKQNQIYVVRIAGAKINRLTSGSRASLGPAWSHDGTRLAFVTGSSLVTATAAGRRLTATASPGGYFPDSAAWSRDDRLGATAVTASELTATVIVIDSHGRHVIALTGAGTADSSRGPVWSPDGRRLAFCLQGPRTAEQGGVSASGELDLAVARADGTGRRVLTTAPGSEYDPSWSPDGRLLLYEGAPPNRPGSEGTELRLAPAAGGASHLVVRLASAAGASWSPTGKLIAFAGSRPGEMRTYLYVVRPDGTGLRRLTGEVTSGRPVWSPDGRLIAYATYHSTVEAVAPDGSGRRTLVSLAGADIERLAWSPDGESIAFDARLTPPED